MTTPTSTPATVPRTVVLTKDSIYIAKENFRHWPLSRIQTLPDRDSLKPPFSCVQHRSITDIEQIVSHSVTWQLTQLFTWSKFHEWAETYAKDVAKWYTRKGWASRILLNGESDTVHQLSGISLAIHSLHTIEQLSACACVLWLGVCLCLNRYWMKINQAKLKYVSSERLVSCCKLFMLSKWLR